MTEENFFDVIVVGAGISGIGSAYRLQKECQTGLLCYSKVDQI